MDIEEKKQKAKRVLAEIELVGFLVLLAMEETNRKGIKLGDTFSSTILSKMETWCETFNAIDLYNWCLFLSDKMLIGLAGSAPKDEHYSLSFDAQRLILWVTQWVKAGNASEEWALYIPRQYGDAPSQKPMENASRARAA